jgi:hypothetical protein
MAAFVIAAGAYFLGKFGFSSVCSRCGKARWTQEWQMPGSQITLFSHSTESDTALSATLRTNSLLIPHRHAWLFVHGGGNGVRCALGNGGRLLQLASYPQTAELVGSLYHYHEFGYTYKVLTNMFDFEYAEYADWLLFSIPEGGFTNATQIHEWIVTRSEEFETISKLSADK